MSNSPIENKTIRPGSLSGYSYYRSNRRPVSVNTQVTKKHHNKSMTFVLTILALLFVLVFYNSILKTTKTLITPSTSLSSRSSQNITTPQVSSIANQCAGNSLNQLVLVSISKRHLWVCQTSKEVYYSPVVTGMSLHPDTVTPIGTYHIYAKSINATLTGSDSTGSWSDPVSYWMTFLENQFGTYGLHDATWRPNSAFGNIDPGSSQASHGCVELPLATAKWIYNWAQVGTTVVIES